MQQQSDGGKRELYQNKKEIYCKSVIGSERAILRNSDRERKLFSRAVTRRERELYCRAVTRTERYTA